MNAPAAQAAATAMALTIASATSHHFVRRRARWAARRSGREAWI